MKLLAFLFYTVIAVIAIALGSQNGQMIKVNYLFGEGEVSLAIIIAASFLAGAGVATISIALSSLFRWLKPKNHSSHQEV